MSCIYGDKGTAGILVDSTGVPNATKMERLSRSMRDLVQSILDRSCYKTEVHENEIIYGNLHEMTINV